MKTAVELLNTMTLEEKVGQLNQRLYGWKIYEKINGKYLLTDYFKEEVARYGSIGLIYGLFRADPWSGKDLESGIPLNEAQKVATLVQDYLKTHTRLKIPVLFSEECPHGHQGLDTTTFPVNFTVGCSWNPDLYEKTQEIVSAELTKTGAHLGLISTLDILRDPRWGRSEECFSEDPYLAACFTRAAVKGLQGSLEQPKMGAVLKHFAGQGDGMGGHNAAPVAIGERELREIHLPAMKKGSEAGALGCMAAYNDLDGIPCHVNGKLLRKILREEFKFSGLVMADGCGLDRVADLMQDPVAAAEAALKGGVDVSLWDTVFPHLIEAVEQGRVSMEILDEAVLRVLKVKEKLGLFQESFKMRNATFFSNQEKQELCRKMARDAIVLLKNQHNILPLKTKNLKKIALIGPHITNPYSQMGDYTPYKDIEKCQGIFNGLQDGLKETKVTLVKSQGCGLTEKNPNLLKEAMESSKNADVIILTLGGSSQRDFSTSFHKNGAALIGSSNMTSGENIDLANLSLPESQIQLVKTLATLHIPMIGILIEGRPHSLEEVLPDLKGLLFAGYPGQYGGKAVAEVLFGKNPNGRLAFSIPKESGQLPVYYNFRNTSFNQDYLDVSGKPRFSFGEGFSYTSFTMTSPKTSVKNRQLHLQLNVKNTGELEGAEVIQVYGKKQQQGIVPREKELLGFKKIYLSPGEEREVQLVIPEENLTYLDENMVEKMPLQIIVTTKISTDEHRQKIILG